MLREEGGEMGLMLRVHAPSLQHIQPQQVLLTVANRFAPDIELEPPLSKETRALIFVCLHVSTCSARKTLHSNSNPQ